MPTGVYKRTEYHRNILRGITPWNKGRKVGFISKDKKVTIEKLKNIQIGRKKSDETKRKLSEAHKGMKKPWSGNFITESGRKKLRESRSGERSNFWKGGFSSIYSSVRGHYKYRQWRSGVFERDDFTCQLCGVRGGNLEADHIKLFSDIIKDNNIKTIIEAESCVELWDLDNGRTLCLNCHNLTKTEITKKVREEERAEKRDNFWIIR